MIVSDDTTPSGHVSSVSEASQQVGRNVSLLPLDTKGGGRQRVHDLPADAARALPVGRDGDRRHGQRAAGRADADGRPARHGRRDRLGAHARRAEAQRPVRRRGPRCAGDARCTRSRRCTTRTATSPSRACGASRGRAPPTATRSSATWPRSSPASRSSARAASASGSGRGRRRR